MPSEPGSSLGPYQILAPLGAGGMGEVYRARDPRLARDVAIKVLPAGLSTDRERLRRFEQEARAAAALNNPNILAVYDVGEHEGAPYLVSELLDGETLRARLSAGPLPVRRAVEYAAQIARGLAAAHEKGIVHRDLKPENVFVTSDGLVKILDFGLAKLTHPEASPTDASAAPTATANTAPGIILGTIGYLSPEQARGLHADHRADIFAFGAILYEMLSGRRAFRGDTLLDTLTAIAREDPLDLPVAERLIPPALVRIVERCLQKNPSTRFQSASDLGFALDGLSSRTDTLAVSVGAVRPPAERLRNVWLVSCVALVVALATASVMYVARPAPEVLTLKATVLPPQGTTISDRSAAQGGVPARRLSLSPDGQRIAFTAAGRDGVIWLWLQRLDSLTANRIEGSEGAVYPFWSPDGRTLAFFSEDGKRRSKLMRVDTSGGGLATVCELTATNSTGGTWGRDDTILFGIFGPPEGRILRVPATGGTPAPATSIDGDRGETRHYSPAFLPDGRHFLYLAVGTKGGGPFTPNGLYVGSLDSQDRKLIMPVGSMAKYAAGHLFFLRESTLMAQTFDPDRLELGGQPVRVAEGVFVGGPTGVAGAFTVSDSGRLAYQAGAPAFSQLTWFDRERKPLGVLGEPGFDGDVSLSPDGIRVVVSRLNNTLSASDLWLYDARGVPTRLTFDATADEWAPVWSPDGQRVAFSSNRKDLGDVYVKAASGSGAEEVLFAGSEAEYPVSWSRDGKFVAYVSADARTAAALGLGSVFVTSDLWVLPLFGDGKPSMFASTPFRETGARLDSDGRWMAYVSNESGRSEVYVAPFPGPGAKVLISTAGGSQPRWRRDGQELFFLTPQGGLMAATVNGRAATFQVSDIRELFNFRPRVGQGNAYDVSPDGQRFLVNIVLEDVAPAPITLVVNWPAMLRK